MFEKGNASFTAQLTGGSSLKRAIQGTAGVLSLVARHKRGRQPREVRECCQLQLTGFKAGSVCLEFSITQTGQPRLPFEGELGTRAVEAFLDGLPALLRDEPELPRGYDSGVMLALRDLSALLRDGMSHLVFTRLDAQTRSLGRYELTPQTVQAIGRRIREPVRAEGVVEGRLLMADFNEQATRCRIHPAVGEPVMYSFDDALREEVLKGLTRHVRAQGHAAVDPSTGAATALELREPHPVAEGRGASGADFWTPLSLEALAESQGATLRPRFEDLIGHLAEEGEDTDEFMCAIEELRHMDDSRGEA